MTRRRAVPLALLLALVALGAGAVACAGLAGVLGLRSGGPRPFAHRAHVTGGVSCLACHAGVERAGDTGPLHLPKDEDCRRCHARPHPERAAGGEGAASGDACLACHSAPFAAEGARAARTHLRFSHAAHVPLARQNCARCHAGVAEAAAKDGDAPALLRPKMATCLGCHEHRDQFERRSCEGCHEDLQAERVLPASHVVHEGDFRREHGVRAAGARDLCATCHTERFCGGCHGVSLPDLPARAAFPEAGQGAVHRGGFRARHAEEARAEPGLCTTCHSEASCGGCHDAQGVSATGAPGAAASPHPRGWLSLRGGDNEHGRAARRDPASCASCHGGAGEMLCVGCHREGGVGGSPHPPGWETSRDKTTLPCRLCHLR